VTLPALSLIAILSKDSPTQVQNLAPVDSRTPFDCFAHNGYYVVDGKIFQHKVYAMQEATRKNLKPKDVTWVFNNDAYEKVDWKVSSGLPLTEWYRQRALQLRAKYDYLILAFSGGGDSTNVLDSFVLNNIHIDEVVSWWPRSHSAGNYRPSMDSNVENFRSEYDYLVEPKLKWLEKVAPNTKITICDNLQDLRPEEPTDDIVEMTTNHCWTGIQRYRAIDDVYFERQKKHKNCAIIMGVNPPVPVLVKRHLFITFYEFGTNTQYSSDLTNRGLRNVEFFYWTPDMPQLVREQAHALLANLRANPQYANIISKKAITSNTRTEVSNHHAQNSELQRRWVKSVIYPSYDSRALQIDKHKSPIHRPAWFSWFYDNPHADEILQPHYSAITAHQNLIHPDFFIKRGNEIHNYVQYHSKFHYIGDWSDATDQIKIQ
jgi:hypothetical protein